MLTAQELKSSPLFHDISYEEYRLQFVLWCLCGVPLMMALRRTKISELMLA